MSDNTCLKKSISVRCGSRPNRRARIVKMEVLSYSKNKIINNFIEKSVGKKLNKTYLRSSFSNQEEQIDDFKTALRTQLEKIADFAEQHTDTHDIVIKYHDSQKLQPYALYMVDKTTSEKDGPAIFSNDSYVDYITDLTFGNYRQGIDTGDHVNMIYNPVEKYNEHVRNLVKENKLPQDTLSPIKDEVIPVEHYTSEKPFLQALKEKLYFLRKVINRNIINR